MTGMSKLSAVDEEYNKVLGEKLALIEVTHITLTLSNLSPIFVFNE
jgi:pantothenate kinase